jgi:hypothetical protein
MLKACLLRGFWLVPMLVICGSFLSALADRAQCTLLVSAELEADQQLTVRWTNTCSFPVVLEWFSQLDDGGVVRGKMTAAPNEIVSAQCRRCALPDWRESWRGREASYGTVVTRQARPLDNTPPPSPAAN